MTRETTCPECLGSGFFGDNGPIVHSQCGLCKGTGVLVEGSAYRHLPVLERKGPHVERTWRQIFADMEERRQRYAS